MEDSVEKLDELVTGMLKGNGVVGSYVIIAEVVHEDSVSLQIAASDNTPPWTVIGLLSSALDIASATTFLDDDE